MFQNFSVKKFSFFIGLFFVLTKLLTLSITKLVDKFFLNTYKYKKKLLVVCSVDIPFAFYKTNPLLLLILRLHHVLFVFKQIMHQFIHNKNVRFFNSILEKLLLTIYRGYAIFIILSLTLGTPKKVFKVQFIELQSHIDVLATYELQNTCCFQLDRTSF